MRQAWYISAKDLSAAGKDQIPDQLVSGKHLIYSSPATLAFNSPGAQGFGVKRAALSIPGSVMLLVSPGCCGRNTTILSELAGYHDRFFYLLMDSNDIVTGRHLARIPQAVQDVYDNLAEKPSVVVICITCVDALLGTDMERVCRKASEKVGIPVIPSYMYALTREGRKPPMVHVRESIYSLLEPAKRVSTSVNILGHFAPLTDDCELYDILKKLGIRTIREISRAESYEEYLRMSEANFNLVLDAEALPAAEDLMKRLGTPYIELKRLYRIEKIRRQYELFVSSLGGSMDFSGAAAKAQEAIDHFRERYGNISFAIGEGCNANPFELALCLAENGFQVAEIFADIRGEDFIYLDRLAQLSPGTRIYSNLEPTMIYYDHGRIPVDISIGKDAGYYHPEAAIEEWSSDIQPFGFAGLQQFFDACADALERKKTEGAAKRSGYKQPGEVQFSAEGQAAAELAALTPSGIRGMRLKIAPFAPDQSGAAAVFCELGALSVIVDAGGCAGNICGFDEPRWFSSRSAIFSAGLRDMDAILGRDDALVAKISDASGKIDSHFTALIGTPVPAVIGTDYAALRRMIEKKTGKPVLFVDSDGTKLYDWGAGEAFLTLMKTFAKEDIKEDGNSGSKKDSFTGILGATPMDVGDIHLQEEIRPYLERRQIREALCYTMGTSLEDIARAGSAKFNIVISPAGLKAARYLEKTYGIPFETDYPLELISGFEQILAQMKEMAGEAQGVSSEITDSAVSAEKGKTLRILIVHQQMLANALRQRIRGEISCGVTCASWFMMDQEYMEEGDRQITSEEQWQKLVMEGQYDIVIGDNLFRAAIPGYTGKYIGLSHFAVSGKF